MHPKQPYSSEVVCYLNTPDAKDPSMQNPLMTKWRHLFPEQLAVTYPWVLLIMWTPAQAF